MFIESSLKKNTNHDKQKTEICFLLDDDFAENLILVFSFYERKTKGKKPICN